MKNFALGIGIGAALSGSFHSSISTGEKKIKALTSRAQQLGEQKIAVDNVKKYRMALSKLTATGKGLGVANKDVKAKIKATRDALNKAKAQAKGMGINVRRLADEEGRLQKALKATNKTLKARTSIEANKQVRADMRGQMMDAVAPVAAIAVPVTAAISFESSMADVKKVVAPEAIKGMDQEILSLSTRIPMAADGIASIVASAGQAGIAKTRQELVGFAETAAKMGVAFDIGGAEAGKMMADWRAGMGLTQAKAVGLADAVNHLSNNLNAQARDLGEVLQRQGAVAMSAGLTETQVASLGAALLSGGAGPEIAATALKNLTGALTKGYAATKAQKDAFSALGFDAEEMAARMQENAPKAIKSVFQALKDAPKEEQNALVSQLFGEESKGAITPLLANLENLEKAFGLTAEQIKYTGSMQKEFEERSKTTANNLSLLKNRANRLGVNLGTILLPAVNSVVGPIGAVFDAGAGLGQQFPTLTAAAVGVGAVFAILPPVILGVKYGLTMVSDAVNFLKLAKTKLVAVMKLENIQLAIGKVRTRALAVAQGTSAIAAKAAAAGQWVWNTALGAGPMTLAKTRVLALAAAQKTVAITTKALAVAQAGLGAAIQLALGPVGLVIGAVAAGAVLVYKYWKPIKAFFVGFASGVGAALAPLKIVFAPLLSFISPVTSAIGAMFGTIKGWVAAVLSPIASLISGIKGLFSQSEAGVATAADLGHRIGAGLMAGVKFVFMNFTPLGWIIKAFSPVKNFLANVDWSQPGAAIVGTLVAGIKSVAAKPFEAVKGMLGKVRKLLPFSDAKEGPLSSLTASGRATILTMEAGIRQAQGGLYSRVKDVAGKVAATAAGMTIAVSPAVAMPEIPGSQTSLPGYQITGEALAPALPDLSGQAVYQSNLMPPALPDLAGTAGYTVRMPEPVVPALSGQAMYHASVQAPVVPALQGAAAYQPNVEAPSLPSLTAKALYVADVEIPAMPDLVGTAGYAARAPIQATPPKVEDPQLPTLQVPGAGGHAPGQGQIVINFNPTIQVSGQGSAAGQEVSQALRLSEGRLKRMMAEILNDRRRVTYG